ncbi:MAG: UDP-N-acetylmuramate--L-alanine ligase [Thermanaeromonas sp.]|uniref:UDP-N-acetylmuramate--L-alanine ligase n=1 Tax=Thermanaeromonas sp. TaxID=2003697 RepID=UPI00243F3609|nr:UDP-N-acetylmuramate--L-alanine ligase [Thermanaeromonas sp.]MCG0276985.1 UDP-N-acetylmuramate--L-alanine ligase [Thermanaeromonas sp.]
MPVEGWTHFVGIGGVGMSALAQLLLGLGHKVSGSDIKENRYTELLKKRGALIYQGHNASNLHPEVRRVVISSAISPENPEVKEAERRGLEIIKRGKLLAELMSSKRGIAVAGAHGKTTTSAMVSLALWQGGLDPTVVVGGYVPPLGSNARLGNSDFFVAEADESDGSFLWLHPEIAVATNIEDDHLDHYGSLENIVEAFQEFLQGVKPKGKVVLCLEDVLLRELTPGIKRTLITYGFCPEAHYQARDIELKGLGSRSKIYYHGEYLGELELKVPGRHNVLNALAAVAVAHQLELPWMILQEALGSFRGVERRFQILQDAGDIWVVDDYAHHPTEIRATLAAARQVGARRIIAVFQPHRYTRTFYLHRELGRALQEADVVIVNDIYAAGEKPLPGVHARLIVQALQEIGHPAVYYIPSGEDTLRFLRKDLRSGDLILTLGAGDVYQIGEHLARYLQAGKIPQVGG